MSSELVLTDDSTPSRSSKSNEELCIILTGDVVFSDSKYLRNLFIVADHLEIALQTVCRPWDGDGTETRLSIDLVLIYIENSSANAQGKLTQAVEWAIQNNIAYGFLMWPIDGEDLKSTLESMHLGQYLRGAQFALSILAETKVILPAIEEAARRIILPAVAEPTGKRLRTTKRIT